MAWRREHRQQIERINVISGVSSLRIIMRVINSYKKTTRASRGVNIATSLSLRLARHHAARRSVAHHYLFFFFRARSASTAS